MSISIPSLMSAIVCTKYGPPSVLVHSKVPVPSLSSDNDILIKVHACGISGGDIEIRSMSLFPSLSIPIRLAIGITKPRTGILGQQFSGQIVKIGTGVKEFSVGDNVYGHSGLAMGCNAEYVKLTQNGFGTKIKRKPEGLSHAEASVAGLNAVEAYTFVKQAEVKKGSRVLIIGAAGNIGTFAVQLAKEHFGAEKVVCVDSGSRIDELKNYGADEVLNYRTNPEYLKGNVFDAIVDIPGVRTFEECKDSLSENGIYLMGLYGVMDMTRSAWNAKKTGKRMVCGVSTNETEEAFTVMDQMFKEKRLRPIVDKLFPLEKAVDAHIRHESGEKFGCISLTVVD